MAVYGAQNYTSFSGVNIKGSVALRFGNPSDAYAGTLSIKGASLDGAREWHFPDTSGTLPVSGTFSVQLPAMTTDWLSTLVTVAGITPEHGVTVTLREEGGAYTYGEQTTRHIFTGAQAGAGLIQLNFWNPGKVTGYIRLTGQYTAVR